MAKLTEITELWRVTNWRIETACWWTWRTLSKELTAFLWNVQDISRLEMTWRNSIKRRKFIFPRADCKNNQIEEHFEECSQIIPGMAIVHGQFGSYHNLSISGYLAIRWHVWREEKVWSLRRRENRLFQRSLNGVFWRTGLIFIRVFLGWSGKREKPASRVGCAHRFLLTLFILPNTTKSEQDPSAKFLGKEFGTYIPKITDSIFTCAIIALHFNNR